MWETFGNFFGGDLDMGLVVTLTGVVVAGFAAVLGIWMERDKSKPPRYSYALSVLILLATVVSVAQSYLDAKEGEKIEEDMARMMLRMDEIATKSGDPELMALLKDELSAQARSNPDVVEKLAQRVADEGGDPAEMLGKHIDASELESISRKGLMKTKKKDTGGEGKGSLAKAAKAESKEDKKGEAKEGKRSAADAEAKEDRKEARQLAKNWDEMTKEEKQAAKENMTKEEKAALRDAKELLDLKETKAEWDSLSKEEKQAWRDDKADFKGGKDGKDGKGGKDGGKDGKDKKGKEGKGGTASAADAKPDKKGKKGKKSAP